MDATEAIRAELSGVTERRLRRALARREAGTQRRPRSRLPAAESGVWHQE
jgi:hypothetical protein